MLLAQSAGIFQSTAPDTFKFRRYKYCSFEEERSCHRSWRGHTHVSEPYQ